MSNDKESSGETGRDIWRDSLLRYLGYANEVGEAFRPIYPRFVPWSYAIAFGYVGCDVADKTINAINRKERTEVVLATSVDVCAWQTLASVLIPGQIIRAITLGAEKVIGNQKNTANSSRNLLLKYGPTSVGLLAIPLIIHPIDNAVDYLFDNYIRKLSFFANNRREK